MSQLKRELNLALVVHETDAYDDADFQVVDIEKLEYISEDLFLIKTKKFYSRCLEHSGGIEFTRSEIEYVISFFQKLLQKTDTPSSHK